MINEYRFTFGMKYAEEPHPAGWPHPDGWLAVFAPTRLIARKLAEAVVGHVDNDPNAPIAFAFDYDSQEWESTRRPWDETHPRGELAVVTFVIKEGS